MTEATDTPRRATSGVAVSPMFLDRWSPRAFLDAPLSDADKASLLEAARWAPSSMNEQPWRIWFADTPATLQRLRPVLAEGNRRWADRAPLLLLVAAHRRFQQSGKENRWAAFDAGAAWMSLALEARRRGLYAHAMGGFDVAKAREVIGSASKDYDILAVVAVGKRAGPEALPDDIRAREHPTDRRPVGEWSARVPTD